MIIEDLDTRLFEIAAVNPGQAFDLSVFALDQGRPIKPRFAHAPAKAFSMLKTVTELRGVDEQLFGHAAADHARASHAVGLCEANLRAVS